LRDCTTSCKLFALQLVVAFELFEQQCMVCGRFTYDGSELFMLRKGKFVSQLLGAFEVFFHWDLMYMMLKELGEGNHWYTRWRAQMDVYRNQPNLFEDVASLCALQSLYPHFREAFMDFVDLMQLDYRGVLSCQCSVPNQQLCADGITVSGKQRTQSMCCPYMPRQPAPGEPAVPLQYGSASEARVAVPSKALRDNLRDFSHESGIVAETYAELEERCALHGHGLLEAVQLLAQLAEGRYVVLAGCRSLLRDIAADSPACAVVQPCAYDDLAEWSQSMHRILAAAPEQRTAIAAEWTQQARDRVYQKLPTLYGGLVLLHGWASCDERMQPVCVALLHCVDALHRVCSLTSVPPWLSMCSLRRM